MAQIHALTPEGRLPTAAVGHVEELLSDIADAYQVAVAEGFTGTKEEWLASLVGPQGEEGPYGGTAVTDPQVASYIGADTATTSALDRGYRRGLSAAEFGAVGDGSTDDTLALQAALDATAAQSTTLHIPRGTYKVGSQGLALEGFGGSVAVVGEPGTVLDMTATTAVDGLLITGVLGAATPLMEDASKGALSITVTMSPAPAAGDILRITSTDVWDVAENQPKGELAEVVSVSGDIITLVSPLFDSYRASTTVVRPMTTPRVTIRDLTIRRNSHHAGIRVQYARDVVISSVHLEGAREALLRMQYLYGLVVENCTGRDFFTAGSGTSYGLVILSCQHVTQIANRFRGGRHAVAHGGWLPCRDITMIGGTYDSYHGEGGQWAVDFHSNCELVRMIGVTVLNGVGVFCPNVSIESCVIRGVDKRGIYASMSRNSDYFRVINCEIDAPSSGIHFTHRTPSAEAIIDVLEVRGGTVRGDIRGVRIDVHPDVTPTGSTIFKRIVIKSDVRSSQTAVGVHQNNLGHAPTVERLELEGNFESGLHGILLDTGSTPVREAVISSARVTAGTEGSSPLYVAGAATDVTVRNTVLAGPTPGSKHYRSTLSGVAGRLVLDGVKIQDARANGGILAANASEALVSRLISVDTAGVPSFPPRTIHEMTASGTALASGPAAPTGGAWGRGDRVFNSAPASGVPHGWVCTVAGTPGTWVSTGNL